jgi:hypothetical protein
MKLPFTIRLEYSSRKKKGGLRDPDGTDPSDGGPWLSNDMAEDKAGECGIGGTLGAC